MVDLTPPVMSGEIKEEAKRLLGLDAG